MERGSAKQFSALAEHTTHCQKVCANSPPIQLSNNISHHSPLDTLLKTRQHARCQRARCPCGQVHRCICRFLEATGQTAHSRFVRFQINGAFRRQQSPTGVYKGERDGAQNKNIMMMSARAQRARNLICQEDTRAQNGRSLKPVWTGDFAISAALCIS